MDSLTDENRVIEKEVEKVVEKKYRSQ